MKSRYGCTVALSCADGASYRWRRPHRTLLSYDSDVMDPIELIRQRRVHLVRMASAHGVGGERDAVAVAENWVARPKGAGRRVLMAALTATGITIKPTSFDAVALPKGTSLDFEDPTAVERALLSLVFVEIKTANQDRVKPDFSGFFFALTEGEIDAASKLGDRHRVALYNGRTGVLLLTSVPELLKRARSTTMQVSIHL
jgi:hypothetical protein